MTDKEKLDKLVAEIERRYDKIITLPIGKDEQWEAIMGAKTATLHSLLSFYNSIQEEPESHKPKITLGEATGKLKELVDNISEEGLIEARKQLEGLTKKCMYSKDNYTDEDRKVLCESCEEECKFNKKEEPVSDNLEEVSKKYSSCIYLEEVLSGDDKEVLREKLINTFKTGAQWKEQQMMAKAIDAKCFGFQNAALFSFRLPAKDYLVGSQVKVIVIKEG